MHFEPIKIASDVFIQAKYYSGQADIYLSKYHSDLSNALVITEVNDSSQMIATPTRCLVDYGQTPLNGDEVWISNYSENQGMREELVRLGVVEETGKRFEIHTGASWSLCKLLKMGAV